MLTWRAEAVRARVLSVEEVIAEYLTHHASLNNASRSQEWALLPVRRVLGAKLVADLTDADLTGYRRAREAVVKPGTVRRELGALVAALGWAADRRRGLIPADAVPAVTLPAEGAPRRRYLSEAEEGALWDVASALALDPKKPFRERRAGYFVCIALETAAREAAIRGLTWDRVDLVRGLIDYRDPAKAASRKRRVPVPVSPRLAPVLADASTRGAGTDFVLGHAGVVRKAVKGLFAAAGLGPDVTVHDLRRTWASLRVQWGVDIAAVAGVLGDTVETTEKHYAWLSPGYLARAVTARGPVRTEAV